MFTRRFKLAFARLCIALLFLQGAVAAYACPAFLADLARVEAMTADVAGDGCENHGTAQTVEKSACHQHYAGDQSVGTPGLASAASAPTLPLAIVPLVEPTMSARTVPPLFLQRATAPPLSIQYLVMRI